MNPEQENLLSEDELQDIKRTLTRELEEIRINNPLPEHYSDEVARRVGRIANDLDWVEKKLSRFK